jgi:cytochrome b
MFRGELAADLLEGLHEAAANLTLFLVVLHLGGVFFSSLAEGENLIRAMITGRKERRTA